MTTLNRDQIISVGHSLPAIMEYMEAAEVTVTLTHTTLKGEPRAHLDPTNGNTLTIVDKRHGEVELFSHKYNNFLPHNLVNIRF
jgi:hypothetical protein